MTIDHVVKKAVIFVKQKDYELPQPIVYHGFVDVRYHSDKVFGIREDNSYMELDMNKCLVVDYKVKKE
jgi:hypothetical protein